MRLLLWYISIMLLCRYPPRQCVFAEDLKGIRCVMCDKRFLLPKDYGLPIPCTRDYKYLLYRREF